MDNQLLFDAITIRYEDYIKVIGEIPGASAQDQLKMESNEAKKSKSVEVSDDDDLESVESDWDGVLTFCKVEQSNH